MNHGGPWGQMWAFHIIHLDAFCLSLLTEPLHHLQCHLPSMREARIQQQREFWLSCQEADNKTWSLPISPLKCSCAQIFLHSSFFHELRLRIWTLTFVSCSVQQCRSPACCHHSGRFSVPSRVHHLPVTRHASILGIARKPTVVALLRHFIPGKAAEGLVPRHSTSIKPGFPASQLRARPASGPSRTGHCAPRARTLSLPPKKQCPRTTPRYPLLICALPHTSGVNDDDGGGTPYQGQAGARGAYRGRLALLPASTPGTAMAKRLPPSRRLPAVRPRFYRFPLVSFGSSMRLCGGSISFPYLNKRSPAGGNSRLSSRLKHMDVFPADHPVLLVFRRHSVAELCHAPDAKRVFIHGMVHPVMALVSLQYIDSQQPLGHILP